MSEAHTETPKEAARRLAAGAIAQGYRPERLHEYRNADGSSAYWRIRAKRDDGDKWIRPMHKNGHDFELGEPKFTDGRKPIYNLDRICADPSGPVWICEGEKACDALTALGAIATTSGGAQSAAGADWTPLRGRDCRLWPDNDDAGKSYAGEVGNTLAAFGCSLSCIDIAQLTLPPKGDAADWAGSHQNLALCDLEALPRLAHQPMDANAVAAHLSVHEVSLIRGDRIEPEAVQMMGKVVALAANSTS